MSDSSAGCHGSSSSARAPHIRSAAKVYWLRSLVPMLRKSTSASSTEARSAADGISTMTPTVDSPAARHQVANCLASAAVATIGAITRTLAPVECRCRGDGRELGTQDLRLLQSEPKPAYPQRGVWLVRLAQERQRLVRASIQGPHHHRSTGSRVEHGTVCGNLFRLVRRRRSVEIEELGTEQADALGTAATLTGEVGRRADVGQQRHRMTVRSASRPVRPREPYPSHVHPSPGSRPRARRLG